MLTLFCPLGDAFHQARGLATTGLNMAFTRRHLLRATSAIVGAIYGAIRESKDLSDETVAKLQAALQGFVESFHVGAGQGT